MTYRSSRSRRRFVPGFAIVLSLVWMAWSSHVVVAGPPDAYFAERIWPGDGSPIHDGVLIVRDGKIIAVGPRGTVRVPDDARRHDLGPKVIIPGLVIAETTLAEGRRDDNRALAPEILAIDGFDPFADQNKILAAGVTTVGIVPNANRLIPGQASVVKLAGDDIAARTLAESQSLRIMLNEPARNPPRIYEPPVGAVSVERPLRPAVPQLASTLGGAVAGLRAVFRAAQETTSSQGDARGQIGSGGEEEVAAENDVWLGCIADCISKKQPIRITANEPAEIRAAMALAREFNLQVILVDPANLDPFLEQIKDWSGTLRGVVLNPGVRPGQITNTRLADDDRKSPRLPWEQARDLLRAGVKVAIRPSADEDLPEMLFLGGLFTRGEIPPADVLRMLTSAPAELLGVSSRVGSLAAGKDADFAILSDDPFSDRARVLATYIGGSAVGERSSEGPATVITAAAIYTGNGQILERGSIVVAGTTVRSLGRDVSAPIDAKTRKYSHAVIVPGFIDLATGLGVGGSLGDNVPTETKLGDQLFSGDPAVAFARKGGVTTVLLGSTGSGISPLVAFKLSDSLRVLKDPVALRFAVTGNLTSQAASLRRTLSQGKAYAEAWARYDALQAEYEKQLKEYEAALAKYEAAQKEAESKKSEGSKSEGAKSEGSKSEGAKPDGAKSEGTTSGGDKPGDKPGESKPDTDKPNTPPASGDSKTASESASKSSEAAKPAATAPTKPTAPNKPSVTAGLEPYRALFAGKIPAMVEARQSPALAEAIKIFRDEFQLQTVIIGADDVARAPQLVTNKQVSVAVGPTLFQTIDQQQVNLPQTLANHQVPFGFQSQATTGVQTLPLAVQYAVSKGLSRDDALNALTAVPAKFLALDSHIGTLAVGKDADLVVLSGMPFDISTHVLAVMIDGQWVYEKEEHP